MHPLTHCHTLLEGAAAKLCGGKVGPEDRVVDVAAAVKLDSALQRDRRADVVLLHCIVVLPLSDV